MGPVQYGPCAVRGGEHSSNCIRKCQSGDEDINNGRQVTSIQHLVIMSLD